MFEVILYTKSVCATKPDLLEKLAVSLTHFAKIEDKIGIAKE